MVKPQKIFKEIFYILLAAPVLFLLVNKWPYLLVGSVIISILIGFIFFIFSISFSDFKKLADYYFKFIFSIFTIFSLIGIAEYFLSSGLFMVYAETSVGKIYFA